MEVHQHSHSARKKWTHYFWEFLMLFLAVFCGFLAENFREHQVEHARAKEYAQTLLVDLSKDTIELWDMIDQNKKILACFDSIAYTIQHEITGNKVPGRFYFYCNAGTNTPIVTWNNATLIQLTQSGNLRYFSNPVLVNKISHYHSQASYISILNESDREKRNQTFALRNRILDYTAFQDYSPLGLRQWDEVPDSLMNAEIDLAINDKKILGEFGNSFENRKTLVIRLVNEIYPSVMNEAKELIDLLKKEYHLEK